MLLGRCLGAACVLINTLHRPPAAANRTLAHSTRVPENWRAHGARERAIGAPRKRRTVDSIASLRNAL
eukprot:11218135-Lingulodinium_polyedra.AAC.1